MVPKEFQRNKQRRNWKKSKGWTRVNTRVLASFTSCQRSFSLSRVVWTCFISWLMDPRYTSPINSWQPFCFRSLSAMRRGYFVCRLTQRVRTHTHMYVHASILTIQFTTVNYNFLFLLKTKFSHKERNLKIF